MPTALIRPSTEADAPAIHEIYAWNVMHGTGTFEIDPPTLDEMKARRQAILSQGCPWLVVEQDQHVLGYAYASVFRTRLAWSHTLEDSIYLAPQAQRKGLGALLLMELIARCTALGARQLLAMIGDSNNIGSLALHRRCGFSDVGAMKSVGWKQDRWLDCWLLQRPLGASDRQPPNPRS